MTKDSWLSLVREDALEPDLPICDPHHHLWDYPDSMSLDAFPAFTRTFRRYLLPEIVADTSSGHNVVSTVFVECNSMYSRIGPRELRHVGETEFVNGIAAQSASGQYGKTEVAAGIVSFADLRLGSAVGEVLDAHMAASRRFRGTRFSTNFDTTGFVESRVKVPELLSDPKFREGFAELGKRGLSFDSWIYYTQLGQLAGLARAFPRSTWSLTDLGPRVVNAAQTSDELLDAEGRLTRCRADLPLLEVELPAGHR